MNEREIFVAALEIDSTEKRQAYLDRECGIGTPLRYRIDALLVSLAEAGPFLDCPAVEQSPESSDARTATLTAGGEDSVDSDDSDVETDPGPDLSFLEPSTKPESLGRLGHYEILQLLGRGAFGIVFKAFDEKLHRYVAIKAMNPQLATTSPPRKRFLREARSVASIKHENIVQVYSVEEQPLPYLVMECVEGESLQQKLNGSGPLEVAELLHLGRQMAAGLAAAHARGLIHRDIKPGNILLEAGAEQKVKITDFGLARAVDDASLTRTGTIAGTPLYMAPEQARGLPLDHRSDLFSLGSVLYQMASGRPPFRAENSMAVLKRVIEDTPRPIQDILPGVPGWLVAIIDRLLSKAPDDRYQTAKEVADLLDRCQAEWELTGQVAGVPARTGVPIGQQGETASRSPQRVQNPTEPGGPSNPKMPARSQSVLGQAWREWWSERDQWIAISVQTLLGVAYLFGMICFVSMGGSTGRDLDGHSTFAFRMGAPAPWLQLNVYPQPNRPFEAVFHLFSSSVLMGLLGCAAYFTYWRIEKVRNPKMSRWDRPAVMLGVWGLVALLAIGIGYWQGYGILARSNVKVDSSPVASVEKASPPGPQSQPSAAPPSTPAIAIAPFDADQAKLHQEAWAKHLGVPVEYTNSIGMKFRLIPPGEFQMGSSTEEVEAILPQFTVAEEREKFRGYLATETPRRTIVLKEAAYLGATEVTQQQYERVVGTNPAFHSPTGAFRHLVEGLDTKDFPVEVVTWDEAAAFCAKLSKLEQIPQHYALGDGVAFPREDDGYQLPSETLWEFACRGGTTSSHWYGENVRTDGFEWQQGVGGNRTHAVAELKANAFGLFDMHGNVHEFCEDLWSASSQAGEPVHVFRGGYFNFAVFAGRSASRQPLGRDRMAGVGFRVSIPVGAIKSLLGRANGTE